MRFLIAVWTAILLAGGALSAQELATPSEPPILRIEGKIAATNAEGAALFDLAMLDALPQEEFTTSTIWTEGTLRFSGPPLSEVLRAVGASGPRIAAKAINDYTVDIPVAEIGPRFPILATRIDGQPFGVREKGPIWIVYPYDADSGFRTETAYGRSVWQLAVLTLAD